MMYKNVGVSWLIHDVSHVIDFKRLMKSDVAYTRHAFHLTKYWHSIVTGLGFRVSVLVPIVLNEPKVKIFHR